MHYTMSTQMVYGEKVECEKLDTFHPQRSPSWLRSRREPPTYFQICENGAQGSCTVKSKRMFIFNNFKIKVKLQIFWWQNSIQMIAIKKRMRSNVAIIIHIKRQHYTVNIYAPRNKYTVYTEYCMIVY